MKALILADIQNDFLPSGALGVPRGDEVIPVANRVQPCFDLVVVTKDWHPPNHGSFAANHPGRKPGDVIELNGLQQILWPNHCVQGTIGAEFAPGLDVSRVDKSFFKGTDPDVDSYSAFFDNGHRKATGLGGYLKHKSIADVYILGLATDYCVKFTALDACRLGFRTYLIEDGCRGVNLQPGDAERAIDDVSRAGVEIVRSEDLEPTSIAS